MAARSRDFIACGLFSAHRQKRTVIKLASRRPGCPWSDRAPKVPAAALLSIRSRARALARQRIRSCRH